MKKKTDWQYCIGWLIFWCVSAGVVGALIQIVRFGTLVESGGIGPAGF